MSEWRWTNLWFFICLFDWFLSPISSALHLMWCHVFQLTRQSHWLNIFILSLTRYNQILFLFKLFGSFLSILAAKSWHFCYQDMIQDVNKALGLTAFQKNDEKIFSHKKYNLSPWFTTANMNQSLQLSTLPVRIPSTSITSNTLEHLVPASVSVYSTDSNSMSDGCENERSRVPLLPMNFILEGKAMLCRKIVSCKNMKLLNSD